MSKKFYWVKTEKKDFLSRGMQVLKNLPDKEKLFYLYMTLFYESIDQEGVLTNDDLEVLSMLFDDSFEDDLAILVRLKLINRQDELLIIPLVSNKIESIKQESIERKERRTKRGQKQTKPDTVQNNPDKNGQCPVVSENVLYKEKIREEKRREDTELDIEIDTKKSNNTEEIKKETKNPSPAKAAALVDLYIEKITLESFGKPFGSRDKAIKFLGMDIFGNKAILKSYTFEDVKQAINNYFTTQTGNRYHVNNFFSEGYFKTYLPNVFKTEEEITKAKHKNMWNEIEDELKNKELFLEKGELTNNAYKGAK